MAQPRNDTLDGYGSYVSSDIYDCADLMECTTSCADGFVYGGWVVIVGGWWWYGEWFVLQDVLFI